MAIGKKRPKVGNISVIMMIENLAATCRSLHELVESELGWSYLIRTKFGHRLWLLYARQIFYQHSNQQIYLHVDFETMEHTEVAHECATIPATFLLNEAKDQIMPVTRVILRSYRYHLEVELSKDIVHIAPSEHIFRRLVSFNHVHSEYLSDTE